ncbi:MAG: hypothetical protein J2P54_25365 [Bradyrhizobiaceae bacterium]|nr:hypothetical protein [Bradyrhizobiaceae bacterium]
MKIDKTETIGGKPLKYARDLLRKANQGPASGFPAKFFDPPEVFEEMLKRGWIEQKADKLGTWYEVTELGNAIANVRLVKRIDRTTANKLVADLLDRVDGINADEGCLYRITEIRAFGSYITDSDDLGDIDLILRIESKFEGKAFSDACLKYAEKSGRRFNSYVARLTAAGVDLRRMVKDRSPYISLHEPSELEELEAPSKILYPRTMA